MKKFFSIAFIAILGLFLVACGGDDTTTAASTTEPAETTEAVALSTLIDSLKTEYAATLEDETFLATEDLTLLETISGYTITWTSNKTDYLANDGTVTRPTYSVGDQTVALTASVTDGTDTEEYTFFVTVQALDKSDQERADEVFLDVVVFPNKEYWTIADSDSLEFLAEGEDEDGNTYDVSWSSSNTDALAIDGTEGEIFQSLDAAVDVTVTATVTINGVDFTKDVEFSIAQIEAPTEVTTIAAALALGEGEYAKVTGVTICDIDVYGDVYFTDGVDVLYIYGTPFDAEIGDVLDISGEIAYYYYAPQFVNTDSHPVVATESTATAVAAPVTTVTSVTDLLDNLEVPSETNGFEVTYFEVTGSVYYDEDWGKYSVFLVDSDYDFTAELDEGATQPDTQSKLMIYYASNDEVLQALHGKEITITVLAVGYRTDKYVFYANFWGTSEDVTVTFASDTEAAQVALDSVMLPEEIVEGTTLDLPAGLYGVDLTYASDNEAVINSTTGVVDLSSLTTRDVVTVTVTATKGEVTLTKEVEITVGELPVSTVAELIATDDDEIIQVQGVIYAICQYGFFIEDETGQTFVFTYKDDIDYELGDEVLLIGTVGSYEGAKQLKDVEEYTTPLQTGQDYTQTPIVYVDGTTELVHGQVYTVTGRVAIEGEYDNVFIYYTDEDAFEVYYKSPADSITALEGFEGKVVTADFIYYNDSPQVIFVGETEDITEYIMTDTEIVAADIAALDLGGNIYEATDIVLPATGANGSTITWAITTDEGSNASITEGTLSLAGVTETATVELTATVTSNEVTDTEVITFTLMNVTQVDLGDFDEQVMGSTVAINGVVYAVSQNGFFVEDATGQLFVYDWDATYVVGDEVDLIGEVAQYKGSYQLANVIDLADPVSTENDVEMEAVVYEPGVTVLVPGQLYTVYGTVAIEGDHNNVFIYYSETEAFEIYYNSQDASIEALEALVGEMVAVQMVYYNDSTSFIYDGEDEGVQLYAIVTDFSDLFAMTGEEPVYDLATGTLIKLTGVVVGNSYDGLFLQDENGVGFFMYRPNETGINIGDKVVYLGELAEYKDARQLAYGAELLEVLSTGNLYGATGVTADEIDAFDMNDAGTLYTFDGFTFEGVSGSDMLLGYVLEDGVTEGTVKVRYYSNWAGLSLVADNYEVGDALPEVEFILYNFRDDEIQLDVVSVPALEAANEAFETSLANALAYVYGDYTYNVNSQSVNGFVVNNDYLESELLAYYSEDYSVGIMHDLARFLGAIYRADDSSVTVITYDGVDYTWNAAGTLAGSNWEDASGTTLVSVITADFVAETLTDSVTVTLVDANTFTQDLTLNFDVAMDVTGVVVDEYTITYDSAGTLSTGVADGTIDAELITVTNDGASTLTVEFYKNDATTFTIFNNSALETRLYGNSSTEGGELVFTVDAGYVITSITVNTSRNDGFSVNDGDVNTIVSSDSTNVIEGLETQTVSLQNVSDGGQVRITDIVITYEEAPTE